MSLLFAEMTKAWWNSCSTGRGGLGSSVYTLKARCRLAGRVLLFDDLECELEDVDEDGGVLLLLLLRDPRLGQLAAKCPRWPQALQMRFRL